MMVYQAKGRAHKQSWQYNGQKEKADILNESLTFIWIISRAWLSDLQGLIFRI